MKAFFNNSSTVPSYTRSLSSIAHVLFLANRPWLKTGSKAKEYLLWWLQHPVEESFTGCKLSKVVQDLATIHNETWLSPLTMDLFFFNMSHPSWNYSQYPKTYLLLAHFRPNTHQYLPILYLDLLSWWYVFFPLESPLKMGTLYRDYGLVWKWRYPITGHSNGEDGNAPVDLGLPSFETNLHYMK